MAADYSQGPERKGKLYCSPWCGMGCTFAAFEKATDAADALAKQLGEGWEPHVWENMGWHYRADRGEMLSLYTHGPTDFTCYFNTRNTQFIGGGITPELAVGDASDKAHAMLDQLREDLGELP
jgi:hypothetical protein